MTRGASARGADGAPRILSKSDCEALAHRVFAFAAGGGETRCRILTWSDGELRWARNRASLSSDRRDIVITVVRFVHGQPSSATTNQLDDESLHAAVRDAERAAQFYLPKRLREVEPPPPILDRPATAIWSDATFSLTTVERGQIVEKLIQPAEQKGLLSFGYLEVRGGALMRVSSLRPDGPYPPWDQPYAAWTQSQCSLTVRDSAGAASGWAGLSSYDWHSLDPSALGARAVEKCEASRNPVAIEPGRYTVILEPQAVADLVSFIPWDREAAERGGPWFLAPDDALGLGRSKLGLKVMDSRITFSHDPADPQLGILPVPGMRPVTWVDHGVLTALPYPRDYALRWQLGDAGVRGPIGYRMSGGTTSLDEMIRTTQRGLLVTRFFDISQLDIESNLLTGLTRDGLWLIERGKISKAVKNFRFTESPLFVLNSIEQLGEPVRVFSPVKDPEDDLALTPAIVPPIKARDFSFTSLIDAI